ncbi:MAG TPA: DUF4421 family protein [Flavobacteriales bacterium]|nr:DUF4421 family protein [Flavobacteriales bacterium]
MRTGRTTIGNVGRLLITVSLLLCIRSDSNAQFGAFVRKLLVGDTLAPPNYDTAYISTFRQRLTLSLVSSYRLATLDISDTLGHAVSWSTNNATQYGVALDSRWLSVEATFSIPALDPADPLYGRTSSKGVALGYTGRHIWVRGFWNYNSGFYADPPNAIAPDHIDGQPWPHRPDLGVETWMASVNYALNRKNRYSQVAALTQMERQKRSAGTFVCGAAFWLTRMNADSALVPTTGPLAFAPEAGIRASRRTIVGTTVGYAHTFVFWHKGFIHLALLAGAGYSDQTRTMGKNGERAADTGVSALMEFKGGIGFNGDRWYTGLTLAYYLNEDADDHVAMLGSMYGSARWAIGYRLGRPNIKGLDKVGL